MSVVAARELEEDSEEVRGGGDPPRLAGGARHGHPDVSKGHLHVDQAGAPVPRLQAQQALHGRAGLYQERVKAIQQAHGLLPHDVQGDDSFSPMTMGGGGAGGLASGGAILSSPSSSPAGAIGGGNGEGAREGSTDGPAAQGLLQRARREGEAQRKVGRRHWARRRSGR